MLWCIVTYVVGAVCLVGTSNGYLLPGDVIPTHYDLRLAYDIDPKTNFTYFGVVNIMIIANRSTSKIILHAQDFDVSEEDVSLSGLDSPKVESVKLNDTFNHLTLSLNGDLQEGREYKLTIPFYGNLRRGLDGVYLSTYVKKDSSKTQYLIATQFEAISARKGFPCFDEPVYKATFSINIGHNREFTAVSNMPLVNSSDVNALEDYWPWATIEEQFRKSKSAYVWDQFEKSVPMSTYLVAFVVSTFSFVESSPKLSPVRFRIWARTDAMDQTSYAATIGPKVLSHFEKFFNISFPLPKQDMIAIPDFAAGAMENWGLITYRETALLYDKKESSFLNKERVAEVIAHELAHQWFGNLVTMRWWSDLWLNEGFATFVASVGVAAAEPTWRAEDAYAVDNALSVLNLDALKSSHPVSVQIDDPKRISEIFDEISYRKGSTLIRMMSMFLGEDVFRKALHNYLLKYSYSNAEQDDLWAELTAVTREYSTLTRNVTVKEVMDTWTKQTGYPLLTVTRDYTDKTLTVSQNRFLSLDTMNPDSHGAWWVPLSVLCERDERRPAVQWLGETEGRERPHRFEHGASPDQWVVFNYDMIAPYRVTYDDQNWQLLSNALRGAGLGRVPVMARVQLLSDAFALAWRGELPYHIALQLASYLQREKEFLPLHTGLRALAKINNVLKRSPEYGAFQKYMRRLIGQTYERVGGLAAKKILDEDNLTSVKMQTTTSQWACRVKVPGCEENAIELYQQWMETEDPDEKNPIPLDLRRTVYCVGVGRGSVREWRWALNRRRSARSASARQQLLLALTCSQDVWILAQFLEWTVSDSGEVRRQDSRAVITSITSTPVGYYVAKDFIYNRIDDIHKAFRGQERSIGPIIKTLLSQFTTQKELDEFLKWRDENMKYLESSQLTVSQGIENAQVNIDWVNKHKHVVVDKLREFSADVSDVSDIKEFKEAKKSDASVLLASKYFVLTFVFCRIT